MQQATDVERVEAHPAGFMQWITSTIGRILISLFVPILTFVVLWQGFIFLRDSQAPKLVIVLVAILWGVGGVALLFTVSIVGIIYSALGILKSKSQGILASVVLLSTPVFLFNGAGQQADIPVAFFFLSGMVFLFLQDRFPGWYGLSFLSGVMAGFAGWTKNEGLLFLASFFAARIITVLLSQSRKMHIRQLMYFALGGMPLAGGLKVTPLADAHKSSDARVLAHTDGYRAAGIFLQTLEQLRVEAGGLSLAGVGSEGTSWK
jgi:hypothetical protein